MPHLSPMSWAIIMPMMWMIIMWLMTATFNMKAPHFLSGPTNKTLKLINQWQWTLQGGRD